MKRPDEPATSFDRVRAAIDEWLDAFDAESSELIRAELAQIGAADSPESILARIEKALEHLDADAARLHARGEGERRQAHESEQEAFAAVRTNDHDAAKRALAKQNDHMERATQLFDDALRLKWLVRQYRSAAAAIQGKDDAEPDADPDGGDAPDR